MSYSWTGAIIIKRVRDAIIQNFRRAFQYDPKYTYVLTTVFAPTSGLVNLVNGSAVVTGVGTFFTVSMVPGMILQFASQPGVSYYVKSVSSNTSLSLTLNYSGTSTASTTVGIGTTSVTFDCSKIVINDVTPEDYYSLPSINVMTTSGEEHRFIQEDFFEEFTASNGEQSARRGAPLDITAVVEATAIDIITRDELVDRMYEYFKIITDDLANNGVGILKTSINTDRREFKNDRWYYTSGVTLRLYAEWLDEDITDPNSTVSGIKGNITTDFGVDQGFRIKF